MVAFARVSGGHRFESGESKWEILCFGATKTKAVLETKTEAPRRIRTQNLAARVKAAVIPANQ